MAIDAKANGGKQRVPYISGHHRPSRVAVFDLTTGKAMRRVAANPGPGDYVADEDEGVFTFSSEDAGHFIRFSPPDIAETLGRPRG